jgi:protocatechuate 3,4-dioxygenase beta subunit
MVRWTLPVALVLTVLLPLSVLAMIRYLPTEGTWRRTVETRTSADGTFSLEFDCEPVPEQLSVSAIADGCAFTWKRFDVGTEVRLVLGPAPAASSVPVLAVAGEPVTVTGTVVGPGRIPIEGARVMVYCPPREWVKWRIAETTTQADGTFSVEFDSEQSPTRLSATAIADGYAAAWEEFDVGREVRLMLGANPGVVRGRVVDAANAPVVGAEVWLGDLQMWTPGRPKSVGSSPLVTATTDAEGAFALSGVPPGLLVRVAMDAPGFVRQLGDAGSADDPVDPTHTFTLQPASVITGHVRKGGEPLASARVRARAIRYAGRAHDGAIAEDEAITDVDGKFVFNRLPAAEYVITLVDVQYQIATRQRVSVGAEQTLEDVDLEATEAGIVEGTVTLADNGQPARMSCVHADGDRYGAFVRDDGTYSIELPSGNCELGVYTKGAARFYYACEPDVREVTVTAGQTTSGVNFRMLPGSIFSGVCLDPDGNPVAGALVQVLVSQWISLPGVKPLTTNGDGAFTVKPEYNASGRPWSVYARHEERELAGLIQIEDSAADLSLQMRPGAWASASIIDATGAGVPGVRLIARLRGRGDWDAFPGDSSTDGSGQVTVGPLPSGIELTVNTWRSIGGYALDLPWDPSGETVRLLEGERLTLPAITVQLEGWTVTGVVFDAAGIPAAGAVVRCRQYWHGPPLFEGHNYPDVVRADAEGRFTMPGLPNREATLVAVSADDTQAAVLRCVPTEQPEVEFHLSPPASVAGTAYDADGEPVADIVIKIKSDVHFKLPRGGRFKTQDSLSHDTRTDAQGRYRIDALIVGVGYSLQYGLPRTSHREDMEPFIANGGETPHVVDIYLEQ